MRAGTSPPPTSSTHPCLLTVADIVHVAVERVRAGGALWQAGRERAGPGSGQNGCPVQGGARVSTGKQQASDSAAKCSQTTPVPVAAPPPPRRQRRPQMQHSAGCREAQGREGSRGDSISEARPTPTNCRRPGGPHSCESRRPQPRPTRQPAGDAQPNTAQPTSHRLPLSWCARGLQVLNAAASTLQAHPAQPNAALPTCRRLPRNWCARGLQVQRTSSSLRQTEKPSVGPAAAGG